MKTKNDFSEEENDDIRNICIILKTFLMSCIGTTNGNMEDIRKLGQGSYINMWINGKTWEKLFEDETWLRLVESAVNYNEILKLKKGVPDIVFNYIVKLKSYFPEELKHVVIAQ